MDEIYQERREELPGNPYRLGQHLERDPRSLGFQVVEAPVIKPVDHPSPIPILNQGNVGACTGFAGTRHIAQLYGAADLSKVVLDGKTLSTTDATQGNAFGLDLYHNNTVADGYPGVWLPDDTGSSGLACCKVLKKTSLASSYRWATTLRALASLLQSNSVMIGAPWYEANFSPDALGFIDTPGWQQSQLAGGHEFYVRGIEVWDVDPAKTVFTADNSWDTWGDHGSFRFHGTWYLALRSKIDVKQAVR